VKTQPFFFSSASSKEDFLVSLLVTLQRRNTMFERALLSDTLNSSWDERSRRSATTLTSFALQAVAVSVLLIVPLLRPAGLPTYHQLSTPISLGHAVSDAPAVRPHAGANNAPNAADIILRPPSQIPNHIDKSGDDRPPQIGFSGPSTPGATESGADIRGIGSALGDGSLPVMPAAPQPKPTVHSVRLSHMSEGDLIHKVLPVYPPLARITRIQGQVLLEAVISKQGVIENLRLVSGHPMLVPAALDAVRQWRYRPYILNGEPLEVETQITVNFSLGGN
jgi:protein TonB